MTVTDFVTGEPAVTVLNASEAGLTTALPAVPVPLSGMFWNPMIFASSARFTLALVGPVVLGSNVTAIVHVAPAETVWPSHVLLLTVKLLASMPAT